MVYGLVYDQNPGHVPPHPLGIPYMSLTCDWEARFDTLAVYYDIT